MLGTRDTRLVNHMALLRRATNQELVAQHRKMAIQLATSGADVFDDADEKLSQIETELIARLSAVK